MKQDAGREFVPAALAGHDCTHGPVEAQADCLRSSCRARPRHSHMGTSPLDPMEPSIAGSFYTALHVWRPSPAAPRAAMAGGVPLQARPCLQAHWRRCVCQLRIRRSLTARRAYARFCCRKQR